MLGFGIDQVTLTGHHFSFDRDVFDALDLANVRTFAALDTAAVKSRIERLPWVDAAELTRVYPGELEIRVTERKPYALWQRTDRHYLIDKTGRVLAAVGGDSLPDLPRFAGEGAAAEAAGLMENLARYPEIASRLSEAERVSERRWKLKLANATTIELPADGEVGALEELSRDAALVRLVAAGRTTLDFRGPGRVAVRPEAPAEAAGTASNTGS
jgi:cell division protein FtsQ